MNPSEQGTHRRAGPSGPRPARLLALIAGVALLASCGSHPVLPDDSGRAGDGTLAAALEFVRDAYGLPALAGMIVHRDRLIEMAAVGTRVAGGPEPVTVDDLWHIGSITKAMTATVVVRLAEREALSWSTSVSQALPELVGSIRTRRATKVRTAPMLRRSC